MANYELPQEITEYKLKKVLSSLGLTATATVRKALLSVTHRTRRERINKMLVDAGSEYSPRPLVHKPQALPATLAVKIAGMEYNLGEMIQGLTSGRTYAVASMNEKGMIAIRYMGSGTFKVKFYSSEKDLNMTQEQIAELGGTSFLRRSERHFVYLRCYMEFPKLLKLFSLLYGMDGVTTVAPRQLGATLGYMTQLQGQVEDFEHALGEGVEQKLLAAPTGEGQVTVIRKREEPKTKKSSKSSKAKAKKSTRATAPKRKPKTRKKESATVKSKVTKRQSLMLK